jgi:hypothetical protein
VQLELASPARRRRIERLCVEERAPATLCLEPVSRVHGSFGQTASVRVAARRQSRPIQGASTLGTVVHLAAKTKAVFLLLSSLLVPRRRVRTRMATRLPSCRQCAVLDARHQRRAGEVSISISSSPMAYALGPRRAGASDCSSAVLVQAVPPPALRTEARRQGMALVGALIPACIVAHCSPPCSPGLSKYT